MTVTAAQQVKDISRAEQVWRASGIAGMALGMVSFITANIIQWFVQSGGPDATPIEAAQHNPTVWLILGILGVFGPLVWVAGIVSITLRVRARGWTLTTAGGYLTAAGLIAGVGHLGLFFGVISDAAAAQLDAGSGMSLLQAEDGSLLSSALLYGFLVGFSVGPILMSIGLRRAKLVPVWVPVAAIIMVVANFVGGIPAGIVQLIALVVTFGSMILVLVRHREIPS